MNAYNIEKYIERVDLVMEQNGILTNEIDAEEDLDLDSLTQISLLVCFENEFCIQFPDEALINIPQTYNVLVQLVLKNIELKNDDNEHNALFFPGGGEENEET